MSNKKHFLMGIPGILLVFMMVLLMGCPDHTEEDPSNPTNGDPVTMERLYNNGTPWVGGTVVTDATKKVVIKVTSATTGAGTIQWGSGTAQDVTYSVKNDGYTLRIAYSDNTTAAEELECWFDKETGALRFIRNGDAYNVPSK